MPGKIDQGGVVMGWGFSALQLATIAGTLRSVAVAAALVTTPALAQDPAAAPTGAAQPPATGGAGSPPPAGGKPPKVNVSEQGVISLSVKDENIGAVLELLAMQRKVNIITSRNVTGRVSADLYDVTFEEALEAILHVNGFVFERKGNFIYVMTREEFGEKQKLLAKRVAKVITMNYLNAVDAQEFVKPMLSQSGTIVVSKKSEAFSIGDVPVGKDDYALGATLVVTDFEDNVAQIEALIKELDTRPAQVLVEATILETRLTENNSFGVDFSVIADVNFTDFINIGGARRAADALIRGGPGTGQGGFSPPNNRGFGVTGTPGNTADGPGTIKVGIITDSLALFLRMLDDVTDTTVLSSPRILALNRQPARVLVGQRVGFLNTTATETSTTQTVQFLNTGTQLFFRPFVSSTGEIRMELKPQVSLATIRDAGNGQGGIVSIPDETTQEIVTNVIVRDGSTIVLGGLFVEDTTAQRRQVPIMGDLPIIGAAFRGHDDRTTRRELIFLIRPSIVSDQMAGKAGADVEIDIERIRAGNRQGLLPWSRERMTQSLNVQAEAQAREGQGDKALFTLERSLAINPRQPDALRLRERLTNERELWPARSLLDDAIVDTASERLKSVPPAANPVHREPSGSTTIPRRKVDGEGKPLSQFTPTNEEVIRDGSTPEEWMAAKQEAARKADESARAAAMAGQQNAQQNNLPNTQTATAPNVNLEALLPNNNSNTSNTSNNNGSVNTTTGFNANSANSANSTSATTSTNAFVGQATTAPSTSTSTTDTSASFNPVPGMECGGEQNILGQSHPAQLSPEAASLAGLSNGGQIVPFNREVNPGTFDQTGEKQHFVNAFTSAFGQPQLTDSDTFSTANAEVFGPWQIGAGPQVQPWSLAWLGQSWAAPGWINRAPFFFPLTNPAGNAANTNAGTPQIVDVPPSSVDPR